MKSPSYCRRYDQEVFSLSVLKKEDFMVYICIYMTHKKAGQYDHKELHAPGYRHSTSIEIQ